MIEQKVYIAYKKVECSICHKPIEVGHKYVWIHTKIGFTIILKEAHPECKEKVYA